MSNEFNNGLKDFDLNDDSMLKKMSDYEHKNDDLTHEIFVELGKKLYHTFSTVKISMNWLQVLMILLIIFMLLQSIFTYTNLHNKKSYTDFSLLIHKACIEIQNAMKNLKGFKNMEQVKEACIKVNSIENIADDLLSNSMVELFETNDAINVIKVSSVLNYLEIVTDKAEDVANTIENIMIKYA